MNTGSLTDRLLSSASCLWAGSGAGSATSTSCANIIFAGMSGSAIADAVGIGRIIIGMMTRDGKYPRRVRRRDHRVGRHHRPDHPAVDPDGRLRAGVRRVDRLPVPRRRDPGLAARRRLHGHERRDRAAPATTRSSRRCRCATSRAITLDAFPALLLPVILLFGIYGGVMTPTEGAAAAAAYALLAAALIYRAMSLRQLYDVLLSSAKATTSVGMLIAGALVFNYVVTIENVPLSVQQLHRRDSTSRRSASCCWSTRSCWCSAACSKARPSCWSSCRS